MASGEYTFTSQGGENLSIVARGYLESAESKQLPASFLRTKEIAEKVMTFASKDGLDGGQAEILFHETCTQINSLSNYNYEAMNSAHSEARRLALDGLVLDENTGNYIRLGLMEIVFGVEYIRKFWYTEFNTNLLN